MSGKSDMLPPLAAVKSDRNLMNIYLASIPAENRARMIKSCFPEDTQILQRIDRVEEKYVHPEDKINGNAYLWVAKREGVAPIYILDIFWDLATGQVMTLKYALWI